jgi:hypothetical protein
MIDRLKRLDFPVQSIDVVAGSDDLQTEVATIGAVTDMKRSLLFGRRQSLEELVSCEASPSLINGNNERQGSLLERSLPAAALGRSSIATLSVD